MIPRFLSAPAIAGAIAPFVLTSLASAQVSVVYDPVGMQDTATPVPPASTSSHVNAGNLTQTGFSGAWFNTDIWPVGQLGAANPSPDPNQYVTFDVTPTTAVNFTSLSYARNSYVGEGNRKAAIRWSEDGFSSNLDVLTGLPATGFVQHNFDLSGTPAVSSPVTFRIYFFDAPGTGADWVDLVSTALGGTGLVLNGVPAASNDGCSLAIPLMNGVAVPYDTTFSTTSGPAWPSSCVFNGGRDLWYTYTPTNSGVPVEFTTCGSNYDTALQAFTGDCNSLTSVACIDDACGLQSRITVPPGSVVAGVPLIVRVGGFNHSFGTGTITANEAAPPPPPGATCAANASFETGNLNGWTLDDLAFPLFAGQAVPPGSIAFPSFFSSAPTDGSFSFLHGFDGSPGTIRLYQDLTITAGMEPLTFDYRAGWNNTGSMARTFDVVVRDPGSGTTLQSTRFLTAPGGTAVTDTGTRSGSADLSRFLGQNVRVSFEWTIPQDFTGPAQFELDNISCPALGSGGAPSCAANPGFETGSFAGWTLVDNPNPFVPATVTQAGMNSGGFGFFSTDPTEGLFSTYIGFDGDPGVTSLSQELDVSAGMSPIRFDYRAAWDMVTFGGATMDRTFDVVVRDPVTNNLLQTTRILTAPSQTLNFDTGTMTGMVDLSAFFGRTIRLSFECTIPESFTGPGQLEIDNIRCPSGSGLGTRFCGAVPNSTGLPGVISATGSSFVVMNNVTLEASSLPMNSFGHFFTSQSQGTASMPGGAQGVICIAGPSIGRYVGPGQIKNSGSAGAFSLGIDLTQHPTPVGFVSVLPGETWNFQVWHRDSLGGMATSNFTNALAIEFH